MFKRRLKEIIVSLLFVCGIAAATNDYYTHGSGVPATGSLASSATMRSEFDSIVSGFDKLPTFSGNANLPVFVNSGASALAAVSASTARTNLGLAIGTNVQAYDATLQSLSLLGTAADKISYTTGVDTWAETDLTAFGRSLIDDADAGAARTTLGLGTISTQNSNNVSITGGTVAPTTLTVPSGTTIPSPTLTGTMTATGATISGATLSNTSFNNITLSGTITMSGAPTLSGAFTVDSTITGTKACAANYTRMGPNLCMRTTLIGDTSLSAGCTAITAPAAGAVAVIIRATATPKTNNLQQLRSATVTSYTDSGCTTNAMKLAEGMTFEMSSSGGNQIIGQDTNTSIVALASAGATYGLNFTRDASNHATAAYEVIGYLEN